MHHFNEFLFWVENWAKTWFAGSDRTHNSRRLARLSVTRFLLFPLSSSKAKEHEDDGRTKRRLVSCIPNARPFRWYVSVINFGRQQQQRQSLDGGKCDSKLSYRYALVMVDPAGIPTRVASIFVQNERKIFCSSSKWRRRAESIFRWGAPDGWRHC